MTSRRLLFYCQHSLGLGHLARSLRLAEALAGEFDVVLLNGGRFPPGTRVDPRLEVVNLPPLGHDARHKLVSHDPGLTVDQAKRLRRDALLGALDRCEPAVLLVEMYPFGRRKFEFELLPLLRAARRPGGPRVVCSVRDILVSRREDQAAYDERIRTRVEEFFDAVLVHSDPAFARLSGSFAPANPLRVPVHHTGFVAPPAPPVRAPAPRLIVSSGGGMVGEPLVRAAVEVHAELAARTGLTTTVVAGPFLPEPAWRRLVAAAAGSASLSAVRQVDDLCAEIAASALSLSQCGYNTAMDLLQAGTPAVVVPYADGDEDEQTRRAQRLQDLGVLRSLPAAGLTAEALLAALVGVAAGRDRTCLDLSGAETTGGLLAGLLATDSVPA